MKNQSEFAIKQKPVSYQRLTPGQPVQLPQSDQTKANPRNTSNNSQCNEPYVCINNIEMFLSEDRTKNKKKRKDEESGNMRQSSFPKTLKTLW